MMLSGARRERKPERTDGQVNIRVRVRSRLKNMPPFKINQTGIQRPNRGQRARMMSVGTGAGHLTEP